MKKFIITLLLVAVVQSIYAQQPTQQPTATNEAGKTTNLVANTDNSGTINAIASDSTKRRKPRIDREINKIKFVFKI